MARQGKGFKLPRGYSSTPPEAEASILVDNYGLYGGADISDHYDAARNHFVLCCATGPGVPSFRLRGFWRQAGRVKYEECELAIEPAGMIITGRGNSDIQWIDGTLHFAGWRDKEFFLGTIPSFVPFPSIPSLADRIATLEVLLAQAGLPSRSTVIAAPDDPLWSGDGIRLMQVLEYYGLIERGV